MNRLMPSDNLALATRYWTLALLTGVYALSVLDRYLLGILLPQIKLEMTLSDTSLGLLSGTAFAIFYATLGLPIARLADRSSRKTIISCSLLMFSLMTAICGTAKNFVTLFIARMGVGVGEAGTSPSSYSMISDLFEKDQRSTAMTIFFIGGNVGLLAGFVAGGYVAAQYGWREAFLVAGIPGLVLAPLLFLTLREPSRGLSDNLTHSNPSTKSSLTECIRFVWSQASYRHLIMGQGILLVVMNGVVAWLPSFLARSHGMAADSVGLQMGLVLGLGGPIGMLVVGRLADRYTRLDLRWGSWVVAIGCLVLIPGYILVLVAPSGTLAMAAFFIPALMGSFFAGPTAALSQGLTPPHMRTTSGALFLMITNLIGLGLGPLGFGLLSDALTDSLGKESLRYALGLAPLLALWSAYHYLCAGRMLEVGVLRAEGHGQSLT
ncbi:spinster family MFS transporter [Aequoribacter sp.]|uniref:spinster family MFS transporter n=1 Tax=Aequoribacter sp. TaxID=2847771 RepID=UPI003F696105